MNKTGIAVGGAPHVFQTRSTSASLWMLSACLTAPVLQSSLTDGFASLLIAAAAVGAALAAEIVFEFAMGANGFPKIAASIDGSAVVTGLALALMMPNGIHPIVPAVGAVFAVLAVKHSFGGLGSNWLNPAAGAWLFLRFTWAPQFEAAADRSPTALLASSASKGLLDPSGSPLALMKIAGWKPSAIDQRFTAWLNDSFLSAFGAELPAGYVDLFAAPSPGLIADRGLLALLCVTVVMVASRLVRWYLPAAFLVVYLVAVRIWGGLPFGGVLFGGDMLHALLSGSVVFSSFVLVADPATGSMTRGVGAAMAGFAGLTAFWLRFKGWDANGALLAVPAVNLLAVVLRTVERRFYYRSRERT
jgi:electron transport complex protein RnfD